MKKVLIFLAEGFEELEMVAVYDMLKRANIDVTLCSIDQKTIVKSTSGLAITADIIIDELEDFYDMVYLPGGMPGAINLAQNFKVLETVINTAQTGYVAAICASPSVVLGPCGLLDGKKATCYPGTEVYSPNISFFSEELVVCENIITAKSAAHAVNLGLKMVEILLNKEESNKIKNRIE